MLHSPLPSIHTSATTYLSCALQGSAADLIKLAMANIRQRIVEDGLVLASNSRWPSSNLPATPLPLARLVLQVRQCVQSMFEAHGPLCCANPFPLVVVPAVLCAGPRRARV